MAENKDTWADYSKLVLKELERLNENHEKMRSDFDTRLNEMNLKLNDVKGIEKSVNQNSEWIQRVTDIWSPTQMKEAKDELYKQKNRWVAAIAVMSFIQIIVGIVISIWGKMSH
jgi:polyhydroxyalkanoate synthesis regulator protein